MWAPGKGSSCRWSERGLCTPKTEDSSETHSSDATVLPGHANPDPGGPDANTWHSPTQPAAHLLSSISQPATPELPTENLRSPSIPAPASSTGTAPDQHAGWGSPCLPTCQLQQQDNQGAGKPSTTTPGHTPARSFSTDGHQGCEPGQTWAPNPKETPRWPRPLAGAAPSYLAGGRAGRRNHPPSARPQPAAPRRTPSRSEPPRGPCALWAGL